MSRASNLGIVLLWLASAGCRSTVDVPISIRVEAPFAEGDVFVHRSQESCPGSDEFDRLPTSRLTRGESIRVTDDVRAIAVWVLGGDCSIVAFGCNTLSGTDTVIVNVRAEGPVARCDGRCNGAVCLDSSDAGADTSIDMSPRDVGEDAPLCDGDDVVAAADDDGDEISNALECCETEECADAPCISRDDCDMRDQDGDSIPDFMDATESLGALGDIDGDGLSNELECCQTGEACCGEVCELEGCIDSDADGVRDFEDLDSDDDGVQDRDECILFEDGNECAEFLGGDEFPPFRDVDTDDDGVVDGAEAAESRFDPESCVELIDGACRPCGGCPSRSHSCVLGRCEPREPIQVTGDSMCRALVSPWLVSRSRERAYRVGNTRCEATRLDLVSLPEMDRLDPSDASCRIGICLWQFHVETRPRGSDEAASTSVEGDSPVHALSHTASGTLLRRLFPDVDGLRDDLVPRGFSRATGESTVELESVSELPPECVSGSC